MYFDKFETEHLKKTESNEIIIVLADGCGEMDTRKLSCEVFDFELLKVEYYWDDKYPELTFDEEIVQFQKDHVKRLSKFRQHPEYNIASDSFYAVTEHSSHFYFIKLKDDRAPMWFLHMLEQYTLSRLMTMSGDDESFDYFPAQVEVYHQLCELFKCEEHGRGFERLLKTLYTEKLLFEHPDDREYREMIMEEIFGLI